jgi:hypothetical protein
MHSKICSCKTCKLKGQPQALENFNRNKNTPDGFSYYCRACSKADNSRQRNKYKAKNLQPSPLEHDCADFDIDIEAPEVDLADVKAEKRHQQAQARLGSEYEPLSPGDLGTKDDYRAPNYDREKKQEFNAQMGEFLDLTRDMLTAPEKVTEERLNKSSAYASLLVEQDSRWLNKRTARIHNLTHAREMLLARRFEILARECNWPRTFGTYTAKVKRAHPKRMLNALLTDLHCGAKLPGDENPIIFDVNTFNRRLAYVMVQVCDYKPQYRDDTSLNLHFGGDGIEGNLLHSTQFDQDPLPVQLVAFAKAMYASIVYAASRFPKVDVWCLGGNHGRDKLMHQGRALASRQFNFERAVALMVQDRCSHLPNVEFHIPKAAVAVIPLFDKVMYLLHGDAEAKLKAPSSSGGHASWQQAIDKFNAEKLWAPRCDVLAAGHFHDPALMYFDTGIAISNGMLVPPGGYGRAGGYRGPCGQFLFESVQGFPVGDSRYVRVGVEQDRDSSLDEIIPRFEW